MLIVGAVFVTVSRAQDQRQRFTEIDVERINVVERDGRIRLTLSNRERAPQPVINGESQKRIGGNAAGLIFFNDDGNERGGLTYSNNNASLTFDKHRQNELLRFAYSENAASSEGGLSVIERPNEPPPEAEMARMIADEARLRALPAAQQQTAMAQRIKEMEVACISSGCGVARVFTGKSADRSAIVMLADAVGRPRLRLSVSPNGEARMEFLDANGKVTESLPAKR